MKKERGSTIQHNRKISVRKKREAGNHKKTEKVKSRK